MIENDFKFTILNSHWIIVMNNSEDESISKEFRQFRKHTSYIRAYNETI